ncbi:MAG TPA: InlB B-repeat-containing protein [Spirochaetota bacterium]
MIISVDDGNPKVSSASFTKNEFDNVLLNTSVTVVFSKNMDQTTFPSALTITGGSAGIITLTSQSATTAVYSVSGLAKNTNYTAWVKNVKDLKGNTISDFSQGFTTLQVKTVTFATNGGSVIASASCDKGNLAIEPSDPVKKYYQFVKWYRDSALTQEWHFDTDLVLDDTTLYGKWNAAYNIGDTGPSGGWIFAINANYDTGVDTTWKYEEVSYAVLDLKYWEDSKTFCESYSPVYNNPLYQTSNYPWSMPSIAELSFVYAIKSKITNGIVENYWTNQESGGFAMTFDTSDGSSGGNTNIGYVGGACPYLHARAVRKF